MFKKSLSVFNLNNLLIDNVASFCLQVESEPCAPTVMAFLENHGKNIQLSNQNLTAARVSSYNQGLLVTAQPLARQQLFQVKSLHGLVPQRATFQVQFLHFNNGL